MQNKHTMSEQYLKNRQELADQVIKDASRAFSIALFFLFSL